MVVIIISGQDLEGAQRIKKNVRKHTACGVGAEKGASHAVRGFRLRKVAEILA